MKLFNFIFLILKIVRMIVNKPHRIFSVQEFENMLYNKNPLYEYKVSRFGMVN